MHRIDTPTAQTDKFGESKNGFTRGNPQTGVPATALDDDYFDAVQEELAGIVEAAGIVLDKSNRAQVLAAIKKLIGSETDTKYLKTTNNLVEIKNAGATAVAATLANLGLSDVAHLPQLTGVVGTSRNARMFVPSASATATFTADELIVQTALGGRQYKLNGLNKTINLAATGAGGMDTGAVPVTGFVALYAIYNPLTQVSNLLAVNATSAVVPEVYGGANMPAGYTASALVSVWKIAVSKFTVGNQIGRRISVATTVLLSGSASVSPPVTSLSLATGVPLNATTISGWIYLRSDVGTTNSVEMALGNDANMSGQQKLRIGGTSAGGLDISGGFNIPLVSPSLIYYTFGSGTSTSGIGSINLSSYEF